MKRKNVVEMLRVITIGCISLISKDGERERDVWNGVSKESRTSALDCAIVFAQIMEDGDS